MAWLYPKDHLGNFYHFSVLLQVVHASGKQHQQLDVALVALLLEGLPDPRKGLLVLLSSYHLLYGLKTCGAGPLILSFPLFLN